MTSILGDIYLSDYDDADLDIASYGSSISLKRNQMSVFQDAARFIVLIAGRRFGKTYLSIAKLIQQAMTVAGSTSWYIAPTYRQAKMIAWKILKSFIPKEARLECNEQELRIVVKNGSEISLKGADNPDSLRGVGLHLVILDEFQDMMKEVWSEVVRPMLATTRGKAVFIGTPKGYNHFYDLYMQARAGIGGWRAYHFKTLDGGYVPREEVIEAKLDPTISERQFRQEYEASFENMTGRVYDAFDRAYNIKTVDYIPGYPVYVGIDFNVNPMTASLSHYIKEQFRFFGEVSISHSNTDEMAQELRNRLPKARILGYPDPAGNSTSTKAEVGTTDYTILRKHGIQVYDPKRAYKIVDRINTVNARLKSPSQNGERQMVFDAINCSKTIKALDGQCYKDGTKIPDKTSGLDHYCDNVGYLTCGVAPLKRRIVDTQENFR